LSADERVIFQGQSLLFSVSLLLCFSATPVAVRPLAQTTNKKRVTRRIGEITRLGITR